MYLTVKQFIGSGEEVMRGSGEGVAREWHVQHYCMLTEVLLFSVYMEEKVKLFQQFTRCSALQIWARGAQQREH